MTTEEPTQLDRIEAKLDEVLTHLRPMEITRGEWVCSPSRRRWWQRKRAETEIDARAVLRQLNDNGLV